MVSEGKNNPNHTIYNITYKDTQQSTHVRQQSLY